uniref:DUF4064 domain-containing protein n=1 Tax=uncultured Nocardioidaceae bacterium TaxID=253824 RepID=A0A6J4MKK2_9ACTN|nr:MAG: hypothetical protein AVDCRST_MAG46-3215 [uncultured Nocardioidaceae bacterium]
MTTPQNPGGSNPPQWNNPGGQQPPPYPGQQSPQGGGSYPGQQPSPGGGSYPGQQPSTGGGSYPGYPSGQSGYQQQQYGQGGQGQYGGSGKRPGGVTAAAWITIIMSALTGLLWLILGLAMLVAGDEINEEIQKDQTTMDELDRAGITAQQLEDGIQVFGIICMVIGLLMLAVIFLARGVLKGSNGARIGLVIASVLTVLIGILFIGSVVSILWIIAGIAVIVLLYVGDANRWFASKSHP